MIGGLNPKKMQAMMKQLGMSQEDIDALRITIEKSDGSKITINNPSVIKMNIQGQEMYQISGGEINEDFREEFSEEDIKTVIEKTGCTEEQAEKVLKSKKGDLAEAILELSS